MCRYKPSLGFAPALTLTFILTFENFASVGSLSPLASHLSLQFSSVLSSPSLWLMIDDGDDTDNYTQNTKMVLCKCCIAKIDDRNDVLGRERKEENKFEFCCFWPSADRTTLKHQPDGNTDWDRILILTRIRIRALIRNRSRNKCPILSAEFLFRCLCLSRCLFSLELKVSLLHLILRPSCVITWRCMIRV